MTDVISLPYVQLILPFFDTFWSVGEITLSAIAYLVPTWREVYLAISLPTLLYVGLWFLIPDSPRWHLRKGNLSQAMKIITNAAEANQRMNLIHDNFVAELRSAQHAAQERKPAANWFDLWRGTNFVNILCIHLVWGATLTNFNGMLLNTRNFGADTLHRNVLMTGNCSQYFSLAEAKANNIFIDRTRCR